MTLLDRSTDGDVADVLSDLPEYGLKSDSNNGPRGLTLEGQVGASRRPSESDVAALASQVDLLLSPQTRVDFSSVPVNSYVAPADLRVGAKEVHANGHDMVAQSLESPSSVTHRLEALNAYITDGAINEARLSTFVNNAKTEKHRLELQELAADLNHYTSPGVQVEPNLQHTKLAIAYKIRELDKRNDLKDQYTERALKEKIRTARSEVKKYLEESNFGELNKIGQDIYKDLREAKEYGIAVKLNDERALSDIAADALEACYRGSTGKKERRGLFGRLGGALTSATRSVYSGVTKGVSGIAHTLETVVDRSYEASSRAGLFRRR